MTISVIIPAFNEEKYIENCLKSIAMQIEKPLEVIVIDNNCTDKTVSIANKYHASVIKEPLQGITYARNAGFNKAKGDIIARTDADSIVPIDWTKRIRQAFEKDPKLLGLSGSAHFYDFPDILQLKNWPIYGSTIFVNAFLKHEAMFGFNTALRKNTWDKIKNDTCVDDKKVHEDADLAYHISQIGKVKFDKTLVVLTAPRQIKNIEKLAEYLLRGVNMITHHKGKR